MTPRPTNALKHVKIICSTLICSGNLPPPQDGVQENYTQRDLQRYVDRGQQKVSSLHNVRQIGGNKIVDFPYKIFPS